VAPRSGPPESARPPLFSGASPPEVRAALAPLVEFQEEGVPLEALGSMVEERLLPHLMRYHLPSFHAMFNSALEEGAAWGARVALEWNQGVTNWQVSPGGAVLEELCCQALCSLFHLPPGADATFLYCGSYANQQALYMALHRKAEEEGFDLGVEGLQGFSDPSRLTVVTSRDAHFSLRHGVRALGLGERALVTVEVDRNRRMSLASLAATLSAVRETRDVFCVVATAGTTSTGSVDPLDDVAQLCQERGIALHVDGAYGLAYALVPGWRHLFAGAERADTLSWDPHKQMGVPIPSSVLFARRGEELRRMALFSHYWNRPEGAAPDPGLKSIPSTRPLSALPLVASLRHQGLAGVRQRLRRPLEAIRSVYEALREEPGVELCHEPDTGILCFRVVAPGVEGEGLDALQERVYEALLAEGRRLVSITRLDGRPALRLVAISPEVGTGDMLETVAEACRVGATLR